MNEELEAPAPDVGWTSEIVDCDGAIAVPPDTARLRQRAGILGPDGVYIGHGSTWRFDRCITVEPAPPAEPYEEQSGTWLWGGVLFDHFGHFLVESMSRLWAFHEGVPIDGVCYIPKRVRRTGNLTKYQTDVLSAFGIDVPTRLVTRPTRFERLLVPGQGFGLGQIIPGTPHMRAAVRAKFGLGIAAEGPERLYVSRSALPIEAGGIMGESAIEAHLAREGYEIFHPQAHDIVTQIARYKAARKIIIADGSAGHLFAYVGREDQDVGYLLRRGFWATGPIEHITHFCGKAPVVLDTIAREWQPSRNHKAYRGVAFVQHDMARLRDKLVQHGFMEPGGQWETVGEDLAEAYLDQRGILEDFAPVQSN